MRFRNYNGARDVTPEDVDDFCAKNPRDCQETVVVADKVWNLPSSQDFARAQALVPVPSRGWGYVYFGAAIFAVTMAMYLGRRD